MKRVSVLRRDERTEQAGTCSLLDRAIKTRTRRVASRLLLASHSEKIQRSDFVRTLRTRGACNILFHRLALQYLKRLTLECNFDARLICRLISIYRPADLLGNFVQLVKF